MTSLMPVVHPTLSVQGHRAVQADNFAEGVSRKRAVVIVCDGAGADIGAAKCSERVSAAALEYLLVAPRRWRALAKHLLMLGEYLQADLAAAVRDGTVPALSATTIAAALVHGNLCWTYAVGDSRVILVRDAVAAESTAPDRVAVSKALGLRPHSSRETRQLSRAFVAGAEDAPGGSWHVWSLKDGDAVVLTTDGVDDFLPPWEVAREVSHALFEGTNPGASVLAKCGAAAGLDADNATVGIIRVSAPSAGRA